MAVKTTTLQIRIDEKTKKEAKKIFEGIGLDMSSAVKLFLKQTVNVKSFPITNMKDENGFSLKQIKNLREALKEAKENKKGKVYTNADDLIRSLKKD